MLLPKGNGKTTLFAGVTVDHLLTTPNAECFIGAAEVEQAREMYRFASHFAECRDDVAQHLVVRQGTRELRRAGDQGFAKVLAADKSRSGGKKHAFNPTLFEVDELHAHDYPHLYVAGRSAAFKNNGKVVTITTAGHDHEGVLGQLRAGMRDLDKQGGIVRGDLHVTDDVQLSDEGPGRLTVARAASGRTVMLEWACRGEDHPEGPDDLDDLATVKLANPASFVTTASLEDAREAPGITPWDFARYRANVWTLGHRSWLPAGAWKALEDPDARLDPDAGQVALAVDMGRYSDSAAVVAVQIPDDPTQPAIAEALLIVRSGGPDDPVPYQPITDAVLEAWRTLPTMAVAYDPKYFDQAAEELEAQGVPMVKFPQSNERLGRAFPRLRRAILEQALRHRGDASPYGTELARHVTAGKTRDLGQDSFRIVKPNDHTLIDAAVALAMAHELAVTTSAAPRPRIEVLA